MGWLTTFCIDTAVLTADAAQMMTSIMWMSLLVGRFVCGNLASRFRPHSMLTVMSGGILLFLGMLVCSQTRPVMLIATIGLGLCLSGMYGTAVANAGDIFEKYPVCMGIFVTITCIGTALTPALVGWVANGAGIRMGFLVPMVCAAGLMASAVYNWRFFTKEAR